jgi:hypothetical protein
MITKTLQITTLFLCLSFLSFAQEPPPDCFNPDLPPCEELEQVPLDDKVILLVIAGVLYGLKVLRSGEKKRLVQNL